MIEHQMNQSILISGESGSGKTFSTKKLIEQFLFLSKNNEQENTANLHRNVLEVSLLYLAISYKDCFHKWMVILFSRYVELQNYYKIHLHIFLSFRRLHTSTSHYQGNSANIRNSQKIYSLSDREKDGLIVTSMFWASTQGFYQTSGL